MKRILSAIIVLTMLLTLGAGALVTGSATENYDPSNDYTVQTAENEDSDIKLWFQHSNVKVFQEDTTSTGRDTYSIYMAKNEIQGTQAVFYTEVKKENLKINCDDFRAMNGSGATIPVNLYYEAYIGCTNLDVTNVIGVSSAEESIIREGHIPDAIIDVNNITKGTGVFSLGAGITQTFLIRLKTALNTPSGWYSGQLNLIDNTTGNVIKTATVFAYVWDFEIPEETTYESSIYIGMGNNMSESTYKLYYDYLLENRLCGADLPGTNSAAVKSTNEYLDNPRVNSFKITKGYTYLSSSVTGDALKAVYDDLGAREDFDEIKEKVYFYTIDEPRSQQQLEHLEMLDTYPGLIGNALVKYNSIKEYWPDPYTVVPFDNNFPYPHGYSTTLAYNSSTGKYATEYDGSFSLGAVKDAVQGLIDDNSVTLWCPKICLYTPDSVARSVGYDGTNREICAVQTLNGSISGFNCLVRGARYFNWDTVYGSFQSRIDNYRTQKAEEGKNIKLWWYNCGKGPSYTYCNHIIENTGLQTELMFWQSMQVGSNGYLYYASVDYGNICTDGTGSSMDGSMVSDKWRVNRITKKDANGNDTYIYGNGVLFYGKTEKGILKAKGPAVIGTVRVEQMRDGIEDYEMLNIYREIYGEEAMQEMISKVTTDVTCYLSLPGFDRSEWDTSMTSEDIFAEVRKDLGNAIEAATSTECTHEWDEGTVTVEATYAEVGEMTYACKLCGETRTEEIPVLTPVVGDVNGDGIVSSKDVKLLVMYVSGEASLDDIVKVNSDIDGDGIITSKDTKALKVLISST